MADGDDETGANIQAVSRASRIMRLFNVERLELVTADVAKVLGLNRTTTHRYLTSMAAVGLLVPGSRHSSYAVGPLATRLGAVAIGSTPALAVAPRHMQALSDELRATVTLSLWASTGAMVAHVAEPQTAGAVLTIRPGTVLRPNSAQGVMFAAFGAEDAPRIAGARERMSAADRREFDAHVERAREDGALVARRTGVVAIAAPVFDGEHLCAAMAVVSLDGMVTDAAAAERAQRVRAVAGQVTAELGGNLPSAAPPS